MTARQAWRLDAVHQHPLKPKKWLHPTGIERDYVTFVQGYAKRTTDAVEREIIPMLSTGWRPDAWNAEDQGFFERLNAAFLEALKQARIPDEQLRPYIDMFAARVDGFNKRQFMELLAKAYGVDIIPKEPNMVPLMHVWEAENIRLIQSIAPQYLDSLHGKIVAAVRQGTPLRNMTADIRSSYDAPQWRAELIARDQVGKLNGDLTRKRQESIGVDSYKWRGVMDERERDEHIAREGKTFKWSEPPSDGHPGEPIRCRCWAEPMLPDLDDLDALIVH